MGPSTTADTAIHVRKISTIANASQHDEVVQLKRRVFELEKELHGKGMLMMHSNSYFSYVLSQLCS